MMSRILVLQHVESEGLGIIDCAVKRKGFVADFIRVFKGDRIPRNIQRYAGLIVLGGPMGVYEEDIYPFIKDELKLIKSCLKGNVPVLGICLGSQMLAKAAGADVYKGKKLKFCHQQMPRIFRVISASDNKGGQKCIRPAVSP